MNDNAQSRESNRRFKLMERAEETAKAKNIPLRTLADYQRILGLDANWNLPDDRSDAEKKYQDDFDHKRGVRGAQLAEDRESYLLAGEVLGDPEGAGLHNKAFMRGFDEKAAQINHGSAMERAVIAAGNRSSRAGRGP